MTAINHGMTKLFDLILWPFERLGNGAALVLVSGIFGVLALIAFKHLSRQKAIKAAKDKIKGHLIEIRIYQDDLRIVGRAIGKVLVRNAQYLGLNLMPFIPLAIPFTFVIAQLVVRYAFAPVPVTIADSRPHFLAGQGTTIEIALEPDSAARISQLSIHYPDGVKAMSPLVRVPSEGRAFQEITAARPGRFDIELVLPGGASGPDTATKILYAGDVAGRSMQPERGRGFGSALLWPAEDTFDASSPFARVAFAYPDANLGWLPSGPGGVLLVFFVSSLLFGLLAIKPLRIQI